MCQDNIAVVESAWHVILRLRGIIMFCPGRAPLKTLVDNKYQIKGLKCTQKMVSKMNIGHFICNTTTV